MYSKGGKNWNYNGLLKPHRGQTYGSEKVLRKERN